MENKQNLGIGVGVLIQNKEGKFLLGKRKGSHGEGDWSFPGGHLEFGETIFDTAKRELEEETNIKLVKFKLISVYDEREYVESHNKHVLGLGVVALDYDNEEPELKEPNKCEGWDWFSYEELPENIFPHTKQIIENYFNNKIYQYNE